MKLDNRGYPRVGMEVVEFITNKHHSGRRGSPAIPRGTTLYAIKYSVGGYFTYSYQNQDDAIASIKNMIKYDTDNMRFYPFNVVSELDDTLHVAPKKVKVEIIWTTNSLQ